MVSALIPNGQPAQQLLPGGSANLMAHRVRSLTSSGKIMQVDRMTKILLALIATGLWGLLLTGLWGLLLRGVVLPTASVAQGNNLPVRFHLKVCKWDQAASLGCCSGGLRRRP